MKLYITKSLLQKYSSDRSIYSIRPACVTFPKSENDIVNLMAFAKKHNVSVTPRGGGTGLSGAGIGEGIIVDCSKYLTKVKEVGARTRVQAGVLLKTLRPLVIQSNHMLPSVPLHGDCAIGGNVNTRSIGPRTAKYGTIHNQIKHVRGILPDGRIIDTRKKIPASLAKKILRLQRKIKSDKAFVKFIKQRPLVAGGYNLRSFLDHERVSDIITHLIVGSVGTLLLLTEVELRLPKLRDLSSFYLIHFKTFGALQQSLNEVLKEGAASIEYAGKDALAVWHKHYDHPDAIGVMMVGFEQKKPLGKITKKVALKWEKIPKLQRRHIWKSRQLALPKLERAAKKQGLDLPPGIDDTTFHPKNFSKIMKAVKAYSKKNKIKIASFGHIGVGSLHLRPFINLKRQKKKFDQLGKDIFKIVKKHNGTLVGEHNAGLCRSRYLEMESKKMYTYMKQVKDIFDPHNRLNPKVIFNLEAVTKNLK